MPSLPLVSGVELIKALLAKGFVLNRIRGSHHILINNDLKITVSVPVHKGKKLGRGITVYIIKDAGLKVQEVYQILKKRY